MLLSLPPWHLSNSASSGALQGVVPHWGCLLLGFPSSLEEIHWHQPNEFYYLIKCILDYPHLTHKAFQRQSVPQIHQTQLPQRTKPGNGTARMKLDK